MSEVDDTVIEIIASVLGSCIIELSDRLNEIDTQGVYTEDSLRARIRELTEKVAKASG